MTYAISLSGTTVSIASPGPRGIGVPSGGTTGQVLKKASDTNYDFTWDAPISGIANVVEDTNPQLGGPLDVNGNAIVSTSNANIAITPNGTGQVQFNGYYLWPTQASDGTSGQVLKTNGSGTLSFGDASVVATTLDLTDTPGSYGTAGEVLALNSGASAFEFVANVASSSYTLDTLGTVAEGSITDVVALTATQYANIAIPDPNTLFVITDGTTSIADSDDVTITGTPSDHSFLVYDSATSDWINRTAAEAQADLGISAFGTTLIDDADAATARATLGANNASNLTIGTLPAARLPAITDSYVGHIEAPADGTYYLDPKVAEAREITGVYFAWTAGGSPDGDIDVQIGGTSVLSSTGRMNSGSTFTGTIKTDGTEDVAADAVITVVLGGTNGVADITDLRFAVEYTQ